MKAILFDLDGTLLNLDIDSFFPRYLNLLSKKLAHLIEPEKFQKLLMKSTKAMIVNTDTEKTNKEVFAETFFAPPEIKEEDFFPVFDDFYKNDFPVLADGHGPLPGTKEVLEKAVEKELDMVLATNPLFPREAIIERMRWAGIEKFPFKLITTYENMAACKPNPQYYQEIINRLEVAPEEAIMIGNDPYEDLVAKKIGLTTYLAEDMVVERKERLEADYTGKLKDLVDFLDKL